MDVLRTSVSVLAHFDQDVNAAPTDHAANVRKAERLIAQMPTAVAYRERIASNLELVAPRDDLDYSANFLNMVNGQVPSETMRKAFDLSLVLYTEHELNASTFSARVTVSTLSDFYSGIVAAVGTLKGPLHGGANEEAWKVLEHVGSPENAETWIQDALARKNGGSWDSDTASTRPATHALGSCKFSAPDWPPRSATTAGSEPPSRSSTPSQPRSNCPRTSIGRVPGCTTT